MDTNSMIFPQNSATTYFGNPGSGLFRKSIDCTTQSNLKPSPRINGNQSRFYPHYGVASIRRHTRLYKKGVTKSQNRKIPRAKKTSELTSYLADDKRGRKSENGRNWKHY